MAALALLFSGGIYLASYLPQQPSLAPAIGLLAGAAALVLLRPVAARLNRASTRRAPFAGPS